MKKIISLILGVLCVFAMGSTALAAGYTSESGALPLGAGDEDTAPKIIIGLSPKVVAQYFTDGGTKAEAQWYAIGTVHPGGTEIFGTAQDLNNVYKREFAPGTTINAELFKLPSGPESASEWSSNGWKM